MKIMNNLLQKAIIKYQMRKPEILIYLKKFHVFY